MSGHTFKGPTPLAPKPPVRSRTLAASDRDEQQLALDAACRAVAKGREYEVRQHPEGWQVELRGGAIVGLVKVRTEGRKVTIEW